MFSKLLKQFGLVWLLLLISFTALYLHTCIHTDWIPTRYNAYLLITNHNVEPTNVEIDTTSP